MRIEGQILGFDEYMNLVLDEAEEVRGLFMRPLFVAYKTDGVTRRFGTGCWVCVISRYFGISVHHFGG